MLYLSNAPLSHFIHQAVKSHVVAFPQVCVFSLLMKTQKCVICWASMQGEQYVAVHIEKASNAYTMNYEFV